MNFVGHTLCSHQHYGEFGSCDGGNVKYYAWLN